MLKILSLPLNNDTVKREADWSPVLVSELVNDVIQSLGLFGTLSLDSEIITESLSTYKTSKEDLLREIQDTCLISVSASGLITVIGAEIHLVEIGKEKYAASDDINRLTRWCELNGINNAFMSICFVDKV